MQKSREEQSTLKYLKTAVLKLLYTAATLYFHSTRFLELNTVLFTPLPYYLSYQLLCKLLLYQSQSWAKLKNTFYWQLDKKKKLIPVIIRKIMNILNKITAKTNNKSTIIPFYLYFFILKSIYCQKNTFDTSEEHLKSDKNFLISDVCMVDFYF